MNWYRKMYLYTFSWHLERWKYYFRLKYIFQYTSNKLLPDFEIRCGSTDYKFRLSENEYKINMIAQSKNVDLLPKIITTRELMWKIFILIKPVKNKWIFHINYLIICTTLVSDYTFQVTKYKRIWFIVVWFHINQNNS